MGAYVRACVYVLFSKHIYFVVFASAAAAANTVITLCWTYAIHFESSMHMLMSL